MATLSACLIVRDEERLLPACLASLEGLVDEVCVVDTGSRDRTRALAVAAGARVADFAWCDDFSAARNASLELATGDWILAIDADETLDPTGAAALRRALADARAQAWLVEVANLGADGEVRTVELPRLFRNRPEIRFSRPVHESVAASLEALGVGLPASSGVRLVHAGYLPGLVEERDKRARNAAILRRVRDGGAATVFDLYKLALSLRRDGEEAAEAQRALELAWERAEALDEVERAALPFLPLVAFELARRRAEDGRLGAARALAEEALARWPGVAELAWLAGELARRAGDAQVARARCAAALGAPEWSRVVAGDARARGALPAASLARLALDAGDAAEARRVLAEARAARIAGRELDALEVRALLLSSAPQDAFALLERLLADAPDDAHVQLLAGELLTLQGDASGSALLAVAAERRDTAERARCLLAAEALARGELDDAGARLATIAGAELSSAALRVVLAAVAGADVEPDPGFVPARVLAAMVPWLEELARAPGQAALSAFAAGAPRLEARVPGVAQLVVDEPGVPTSPGSD